MSQEKGEEEQKTYPLLVSFGHPVCEVGGDQIVVTLPFLCVK